MAGDHPGVPGIGDAPFSASGRRATRDDDNHEAVESDKALDRSLILASVARDARLDRTMFDELGCLPFARSGGQLP